MEKKYLIKYLILSIGIFIISILVFSFVYIKIKNYDEMSKQVLLKWKTQLSKNNEVTLLNRSIRTTKEGKILLEPNFVQSSNEVSFLDSLERLALSVGAEAEIISVNVLPEIPSLVLDLKANGSFDSIYKFLLLLENSPYELDIISANIKRSTSQNIAEGKNFIKWEVLLKIKLLSFLE
jgi:hypothetical protein